MLFEQRGQNITGSFHLLLAAVSDELPLVLTQDREHRDVWLSPPSRIRFDTNGVAVDRATLYPRQAQDAPSPRHEDLPQAADGGAFENVSPGQYFIVAENSKAQPPVTIVFPEAKVPESGGATVSVIHSPAASGATRGQLLVEADPAVEGLLQECGEFIHARLVGRGVSINIQYDREDPLRPVAWNVAGLEPGDYHLVLYAGPTVIDQFPLAIRKGERTIIDDASWRLGESAEEKLRKIQRALRAGLLEE